MTVTLPPLPSFLGTEVLRSATASSRVKPIAEPFLAGMSGLTTSLATWAGSSFFASLPVVVPPREPLSDPPQAASNGIPPAISAVATAVEARKLLRLVPGDPDEAEGAEAAFGVIASTLRGAPGHPAVAGGCGVSSGTG